MSSILRLDQIKIGKLIMILDVHSLKEKVGVIVEVEPWDGFVTVHFANGERIKVDTDILREVS